MPDSKITALTSIGTSTDPANDPLVIVDVSDTSMAASGTTKKVSLNNLLACSPTATLASATITGDLTVDTSTLKVDSTNNRVGIGTASPAYPLSVAGRISYNGAIGEGPDTTVSSSGTSLIIGNSATWTDTQLFAGGNLQYRIATSGVFTWYDGAGGTRMILNSTGLGVGRSPSYRFQASSGTKATTASIATVGGITTTDTDDFGIFFRIKTDATAANRYAAISSFDNGSGNGPRDLVLQDLGGNVGIGVTPSAWAAGFKAAQVGSRLVLTTTGSDTFFGNNFYNDGAYKFINADYATYYDQTTGKHVWGTSTTSGAVNGLITWNPAMTLDASGNFLVGTTSTGIGNVNGAVIAVGSSAGQMALGHVNGTASGQNYANFLYNAVSIGSITQNGTTGVLYNIVSDYRLKESVKPISGGLARVNALKPSIYNWKSDGSAGEGFLAHELAEVVPFAVTGEKDAVNEDGSIKSQGIDMSRIVPILVAAIQELTARVQTLETR
jgi:hypothetical protein